jgi:hypothetical protein
MVFPNGHRPNLVRDPDSPDPSRPWVLGAPMQVKLTVQTEIAAGIGLFGLNVGGIHRKIRYLGSHEGAVRDGAKRTNGSSSAEVPRKRNPLVPRKTLDLNP